MSIKPRKRIFYNKHFPDRLFIETAPKSGIFQMNKSYEGVKQLPVSKSNIYENDGTGKIRDMWIDLSFYPAHTNKNFGEIADNLIPGKIYWFHQHAKDGGTIFADQPPFKSHLIYLIKRENLISYFKRIKADGTLQKKVISDVGAGFYTIPKEQYKVVTTVKLI